MSFLEEAEELQRFLLSEKGARLIGLLRQPIELIVETDMDSNMIIYRLTSAGVIRECYCIDWYRHHNHRINGSDYKPKTEVIPFDQFAERVSKERWERAPKPIKVEELRSRLFLLEAQQETRGPYKEDEQ